MNYGWTDPSTAHAGQPENSYERYAKQLYLRTAGGAPLKGLNVLEVGCGRGGGAAAVLLKFSPATLTGMDLSTQAVGLCRRLHDVPGLTFLIGDAEALPLDNASVDVILSVESTHCYGSFETFLSEVCRVLRPGGHLLLSDFRDLEMLNRFRESLTRCGMLIVEEEDLTAGVVAALDASHDEKVRRVRSTVPRPLRRIVQDFSAVRGSTSYEDFACGRKTYLRFVLKKPYATQRADTIHAQ